MPAQPMARISSEVTTAALNPGTVFLYLACVMLSASLRLAILGVGAKVEIGDSVGAREGDAVGWMDGFKVGDTVVEPILPLADDCFDSCGQ